jgi:hypothetical protein
LLFNGILAILGIDAHQVLGAWPTPEVSTDAES